MRCRGTEPNTCHCHDFVREPCDQMASIDAPEAAMYSASVAKVDTVYGHCDASPYRTGSKYGRWPSRSRFPSVLVDMRLQCISVVSRRYVYTGVTVCQGSQAFANRFTLLVHYQFKPFSAV